VLALQATLFYAASRSESVPAGPPLDLFPAQLGNWREVQNYPVEQEIRDQLKADDLHRVEYMNETGPVCPHCPPEDNQRSRRFA
jgi:hypothetical protein